MASPREPSPAPFAADPPSRRGLGPLLDRVGVVASSLCAAHCAATPVLLAAAPTVGIALGGERWEWAFLCASCVLGAAALVPAFLRSGRAVALVVFAAGAAAVLAGKLGFEGGGAAEGALSALGAAGIALAHVVNLRVVRGSAHAHAHAHAHATDGACEAHSGWPAHPRLKSGAVDPR